MRAEKERGVKSLGGDRRGIVINWIGIDTFDKGQKGERKVIIGVRVTNERRGEKGRGSKWDGGKRREDQESGGIRRPNKGGGFDKKGGLERFTERSYGKKSRGRHVKRTKGVKPQQRKKRWEKTRRGD